MHASIIFGADLESVCVCARVCVFEVWWWH